MKINNRRGELTTILTIATGVFMLIGFVLGNAINTRVKTIPSAATRTYCGESCSYHTGAPKKESGVTLKCVDKSLVCPNNKGGADVWWDVDQNNVKGTICSGLRPTYCTGGRGIEGDGCSKNGECSTGLVCNMKTKACVKSSDYKEIPSVQASLSLTSRQTQYNSVTFRLYAGAEDRKSPNLINDGSGTGNTKIFGYTFSNLDNTKNYSMDTIISQNSQVVQKQTKQVQTASVNFVIDLDPPPSPTVTIPPLPSPTVTKTPTTTANPAPTTTLAPTNQPTITSIPDTINPTQSTCYFRPVSFVREKVMGIYDGPFLEDASKNNTNWGTINLATPEKIARFGTPSNGQYGIDVNLEPGTDRIASVRLIYDEARYDIVEKKCEGSGCPTDLGPSGSKDDLAVASNLPVKCNLDYHYGWYLAKKSGCPFEARTQVQDEIGKPINISEKDKEKWGTASYKIGNSEPSAMQSTFKQFQQGSSDYIVKENDFLSNESRGQYNIKLFYPEAQYELVNKFCQQWNTGNGKISGCPYDFNLGDPKNIAQNLTVDCNNSVRYGWILKKKPAGTLNFKVELSAGGDLSKNILLNTSDPGIDDNDIGGTVTLTGLNNSYTNTFTYSAQNHTVNSMFEGIPVGQYSISYNINKRGVANVYINEVESEAWCKDEPNTRGKKKLKWKKEPSLIAETSLFNEVGQKIDNLIITDGKTSAARVVFNIGDKVAVTSHQACKDCGDDWKISNDNWPHGRYICHARGPKYNENCDATQQPSDFFRNCMGAGIPDPGPGSAGCWCTNTTDCSKSAGKVEVAPGQNYCRETADIICCIGGATPGSEMSNANKCCGSDSDCDNFFHDGSKCTGENKDCGSGKKCVLPPTPMPRGGARSPTEEPNPSPGFCRRATFNDVDFNAANDCTCGGTANCKLAGSGKIYAQAKSLALFDSEIKSTGSADFLADDVPFRYEIFLPSQAAILQIKSLSVQTADLRSKTIPLMNWFRGIPLDRDLSSMEPLVYDISSSELKDIKPPKDMPLTDFIKDGTITYNCTMQDRPPGNCCSDVQRAGGGECSVSLIKNVAAGNQNGRFNTYINNPNPPPYINGLVTACRTANQYCLNHPFGCFNSRDLTPMSGNCLSPGVKILCQNLADECIRRIDITRQAVIDAMQQSVDAVVNKYNKIFSEPCISLGLTGINSSSKIVKLIKVVRKVGGDIDILFDSGQIKDEIRAYIANDLDGNGGALADVINFGNMPLDPNLNDLTNTLRNGHIKWKALNMKLLKWSAEKFELVSLKNLLNVKGWVDVIISTIRDVPRCISEIPQIPGAIAQIIQGITAAINGDADAMGVLYVNPPPNSPNIIKEVKIDWCEQGTTICDSQTLKIDPTTNPLNNQKILPFILSSKKVTTQKAVYEISCQLHFTDGKSQDCPEKYTVKPDESLSIRLNVDKSGIRQNRLTGIKGDFNKDEEVNTLDYSMMTKRITASKLLEQNENVTNDLNGDGKIDILDLSMMVNLLDTKVPW
ncbi:hypothetical protein A3H78_01295 [Candidatus Roizmanbacteria bacterium RIFCSPLOWO2_02_FULL_36_11]|uniref:Dockerin domain-containing protein n=1 Tax=Candidatus Roizmanbacteria bacterium RIFCSPLOWO2_02_FULL_36_11 TaxID=1802071 RepID=A0A1F7JIF7_9BACT|nr:MAG: hypothetical protein A3H78_01295 [Candidatus Roizmanbacteria bacterium RIFCSPLOWO2_02_FULL_36_11]